MGGECRHVVALLRDRCDLTWKWQWMKIGRSHSCSLSIYGGSAAWFPLDLRYDGPLVHIPPTLMILGALDISNLDSIAILPGHPLASDKVCKEHIFFWATKKLQGNNYTSSWFDQPDAPTTIMCEERKCLLPTTCMFRTYYILASVLPRSIHSHLTEAWFGVDLEQSCC
jgi:hypothetical protein